MNAPKREPRLVKRGEAPTATREYGNLELIGQDAEGFLGRSSIVRAIFHPGSETRGHFHRVSEELYIVESGEAELRLWHHAHADEVVRYAMRPGDCLAIPPDFVHHVRVTSATDFVVVVLASPPFATTDQFFPDA